MSQKEIPAVGHICPLQPNNNATQMCWSYSQCYYSAYGLPNVTCNSKCRYIQMFMSLLCNYGTPLIRIFKCHIISSNVGVQVSCTTALFLYHTIRLVYNFFMCNCSEVRVSELFANICDVILMLCPIMHK